MEKSEIKKEIARVDERITKLLITQRKQEAKINKGIRVYEKEIKKLQAYYRLKEFEDEINLLFQRLTDIDRAFDTLERRFEASKYWGLVGGIEGEEGGE